MKSVLEQIDLRPVCEVEVGALSVGGSPRTTGESLAHVEMLAATLGELPPIIVQRSTMRVIDGMHRLRAAELRGQQTIAVKFFDGSDVDAFVLAVKSNTAHGLPLSLADRKRAAERIITSHPRWSDRMIASVAGISAKTVSGLRTVVGYDSTQVPARIGRDGRVRSVDGTAGRQLAYELITRDPSLSLRQIAQASGISPETARDVRNRLHRGEGPLPTGRTKSVTVSKTGETADRRLALIGTVIPRRPTAEPPAVFVERLKADPTLRFNQNGRYLLRLLNIHTIRTEDWNTIVDSVPPHCREIVAQLARECAEFWTEFAARVERNALSMT